MSEVTLAGFVDATQGVRDDSHVALNQDRTGVTAEGGRAVRWAGHFRGDANRLATAAFADSLRARYGDELAGLALKSAGLDNAQNGGKPLKARQVKAAVQHADQLQGTFRQRNAVVAGALSQQQFGDVLAPRLLADKVSAIARQTLPPGAVAANQLDPEALSQSVRSAIIDAGRDGAHLVTTEEAGRIQERIIKAELERAHARQMTLMSLDDIRAGRPTPAMRGELAPPVGSRGELAPDGRPVVESKRIYPDELRAAARAISDERLATGECDLKQQDLDAVLLPQVSGAGNRSAPAATARAASMLMEFNRACQLIHAQSPEGHDQAVGRVKEFRKQYLEVLEREFNRMDAEDGARTRRDGAISRPVHDAGVEQSELDEQVRTPFAAEQPIPNVFGKNVAVEPTGDEVQDALNQFDALFDNDKMDQRMAKRLERPPKSVSFGGESQQDFPMRRSMAEFANVDMPQREFPGDAPFRTRGNDQSQDTKNLGHIEALLDPDGVYASETMGRDITPRQLRELADPDNSETHSLHQLVGFAKQLYDVARDKDTALADRTKAAQLAGHPHFAQDLGTIKYVLPILDRLKDAPGHASSEKAYGFVAPVMRNVLQVELSQAQDRLDNPDSPANAEWYQSFEDTYTMEVADPERPGETKSVATARDSQGKDIDWLAAAKEEAMSVAKDARKAIELMDNMDTYFADPDRIELSDD